MAQHVLVTGGTGALGGAVAARLIANRHGVRALSRRPVGLPDGAIGCPGDVASGAGLAEAVAGVEAIVHCASEPSDPEVVDLGGTRGLLDAALAAGRPHLVYVSIVGIDRSPTRYYRSKREAEGAVARSGLPWTVLRATQFHTPAAHLLKGFGIDRADPVVVPAGVRLQPIDPEDVADRLAELAVGRPAGRVPDVGGPEVLGLDDLAGAYLRISGRHAGIQFGPVHGEYGDYFADWRSGANLCPDRATGTVTWESFLRRSFALAGGEPQEERGRT